MRKLLCGSIVPNYLLQMETFRDIKVNEALTERTLDELLQDFASVLADNPGLTDLAEFSLKLIDDRPIRLKPYLPPHAKVDNVRNEIKTMLELTFIEKTQCVWAIDSPH